MKEVAELHIAPISVSILFFLFAFGGSGGDPALASAAAVARRYALRAARAELEAAKAAAAVTELRRDLAEALAREATLRAAHAGAS